MWERLHREQRPDVRRARRLGDAPHVALDLMQLEDEPCRHGLDKSTAVTGTAMPMPIRIAPRHRNPSRPLIMKTPEIARYSSNTAYTSATYFQPFRLRAVCSQFAAPINARRSRP